MSAVTTAATPAAIRITSRRPTPTLYRGYSIVAGTALLLVTLAGSALVGSLSSRTDRIRDRTGPVLVATQQLFSSLAESDAAATAVQLAGSVEDREQRRFYEQALQRSTQQVEHVAALIGADPVAHQALQDIAAQLTTYAGLVESARVENRLASADANATLTSALTLMRSAIGDDVASLTAISERQFSDDYQRPVLLLSLAIVAFALSLFALIVLQRLIRRRARRLISAPIAIATIAVTVLVVWTLLAEVGQRHDLRAAFRDGYQSIALASRVQGLAYRAKADEGLVLLSSAVGPGQFGSFETSAQGLAASDISSDDVGQIREGRAVDSAGLLFDAARLADSDRERYAAAEMLLRWQRYRDTDRAIQTAVASGDLATARLVATTTGNQAFNGFNLSVESVTQDNTAQFEDSIASASHRLRFLRASAILLPLVALLLMLWGTQIRMNEYR